VTFGIKPTYPAEVFGYIEAGSAKVDGVKFSTFPVNRFREKPDAKTAQEFLDAGTFYWNSGIFVWKAKTILEALRKFEPEMAAHVDKIGAAIGQPNFADVLESEFCAIKGTSIDYAVMERYDNVHVIEAPYQWDDLGNWTAVPRQKGIDDDGNTLEGKNIAINTKNSIVRGDGEHLIVTVGMEDAIVIQTPDATLVANRNDEGAIKEVVKKLAELGWDEYL